MMAMPTNETGIVPLEQDRKIHTILKELDIDPTEFLESGTITDAFIEKVRQITDNNMEIVKNFRNYNLLLNHERLELLISLLTRRILKKKYERTEFNTMEGESRSDMGMLEKLVLRDTKILGLLETNEGDSGESSADVLEGKFEEIAQEPLPKQAVSTPLHIDKEELEKEDGEDDKSEE